ncbi:MAG: lysophospholipid acyltransferase family protein [Planctomycetota bacterium]
MEAGAPGPARRRGGIRRDLKRARRFVVGMLASGAMAVGSRLPFALTSRVLPFLTRWLAAPRIGRASRANLELAYGDALPARDRDRVVRALARNLGRLAAELLALHGGRLPADFFDGDEVVARCRALLAEGRGLVLVTGHLGNWEALGLYAARELAPHAGAAVARRNSNPWLQRLAERGRRRTGLETIWQDESPRRSLRLLQGGGFVALVADQDVRRLSGTFVPFFGQPAWTPTGPAALALAADAPILVVVAHRRGRGLVLASSDPIRPRRGGDRSEEIDRLTRAWSDVIEREVRAAPSDWMWFHPRWRSTPETIAARRERDRRHAAEARAQDANSLR